MSAGAGIEVSDALPEIVAIVDRLRSPQGCPWDREQTHQSLAKYLLEESYETLEAIETADPVLLREELGDLLLQVLMHARIAAESPEPSERFDIDDVARDLSAKMIRRHPHVFGDATATDASVTTAADVNANWELQKAAEKQRTSITDGVPLAQPALALAAKLVSRRNRTGLTLAPIPPPAAGTSIDEIGARLFALVQEAVAAGVDPESALRETTRSFRAAILQAESDQA